MLERLHRLQQLRGTLTRREGDEEGFDARVKAVKSWQQHRLALCYADLAADSRYAPAVAFFLNELYGTKDSTIRDRDLVRMYPALKQLLPKSAFEAATMALELDVLSEEFDQAIADAVGKQALTEESYLAAFRVVGRRDDRLRQVALMREVGEGLDSMVKKPLLFSTLKMLRTPARVAGLGEMQQFLEAGFSAFQHMAGADYFLETIASRESELIERIMRGEREPYSLIKGWYATSQ